MQLKRVVITGVGVVSPFGKGVKSLMEGIRKRKSAVCFMEEWRECNGLGSQVAAPVTLVDEKKIDRKKRRSMSPMSIFAVQASEEAIADAGIKEISPQKTGCIIGSTMGSAKSISQMFETVLSNEDIRMVSSTLFFKGVTHTAALNVSQQFGLEGYVIAPAAACASSLHALGIGYDLIRLGRQDLVLCGGAEEVHHTVTGSFDILYATSVNYNQDPQATPRPFDSERDGLVCGEGSGILLLESYEKAVARNARIYAEIIGYNTCGNGVHISQSDKQSMAYCMREALAEAQISPHDIDYINAHATGTIQGDKAEAESIKELFGDSCPVSSLKGYIGHTLGASGAIELIASLKMMEEGVVYPGFNLRTVSEDCQGIYHLTKPFIKQELNYLLKNCFAFGGINATLVCQKVK